MERATPTSDNFTVVRLMLAGLVLVSHSFAMAGAQEPILFERSMGNLAVHGFFALSGFLVSGSFLSTTPTEFARRRFLRLVPGYVAGYMFGIVAASLFSGYVGNAIPGIVNGSLWTINWEILMYCGVLVIGVAGLLNSTTLAPIVIISLLLIIIHVHDKNNGIDVIAPIAFMFLMGAFLRVQDKFNLRTFGGLSIAILGALYLPGVSPIVLSTLSKVSFSFGWDVGINEVRYFIYLTTFPPALLFICQFFPISFKMENDYSYGIYVLRGPANRWSRICFGRTVSSSPR